MMQDTYLITNLIIWDNIMVLRYLRFRKILVFFIIVFIYRFSPGVYAGDLIIPNSFSPGDTVSADTMNANFSSIETEVVDNHDRITAMENRTISFPASVLSHSPTIDTVVTHYSGLLWQQNDNEVALLIIKRPADYAGGEIAMHILFVPTTETEGVVDFYLLESSFNTGTQTQRLPETLNGASVPKSQALHYQQTFTLNPSTMIAYEWWRFAINRKGIESTYSDDVVVYSVAIEYSTVQ